MDSPGPWETAIDAFAVFQRSIGIMDTSIATRRQQLGRVARTIGVPDPWVVTADQLRTFMVRQPWKTETKRSRRTTLRVFYRWGTDEGHIEKSPALALPRVKPARANPSPIPDEVYLPVLRTAPAREVVMLSLAADHGLRRMEVAQVWPERDMWRDLEGWTLTVHGKGGHDRDVPLTDSMAALLLAMGPGYAFPGNDHGHLSPRWVGKLCNRLLPDAWTIHKLRHRAGSRFREESGGDLRLVAELLGHADVKTTMIYTKVRDTELRDVVNRSAA